MLIKWFVGPIVLLVMGLLAPATPALADGSPPGDDGIVILNEDYTLEENEYLAGDLVVFNGDVTLEAGSRVEGSVIVWNGSVDVTGEVEGDLIASGGDIRLDNDAWVEGDVVCSWNCALDREEEARVDGKIIESHGPLPGLDLRFWHGFPITMPSPQTFWTLGPGQALGWVLRTLRTIVAILVIAAVAGLVALSWPQQIMLVGRTVIEAPGHSFGIGLLTAVIAGVLSIALAVTICLSPAAALTALALGATGLFGWIGIGAWVGERLLQTLNAHRNENEIKVTPLWAAGLGTLIITLVSAGLSIAFCLAPLGWLVSFAVGCMGLGSVVLTRFGTIAYSPSTPPLPIGERTEENPSQSTQEG